MSWRWNTFDAAAGDVATPNEIRDGIARLVGEFNGRLDRDNVTSLNVTPAKLAARAMHDLDDTENLVPIAVVGMSGFVELLSRSVTLPVDGYLALTAGISFEGWKNYARCEPPMLLLLVDGVIVASQRTGELFLTAGGGRGVAFHAPWLTALAPCAAGARVVTLALDESDGNVFDVHERQLHIEMVYR